MLIVGSVQGHTYLSSPVCGHLIQVVLPFSWFCMRTMRSELAVFSRALKHRMRTATYMSMVVHGDVHHNLLRDQALLGACHAVARCTPSASAYLHARLVAHLAMECLPYGTERGRNLSQ